MEESSRSLRDSLNSIDMVDSLVGWAVGDLELILLTTNGGIRWIPQSAAGMGVFYTLSSVDRLHAFAGGTVFMSTTNGGESWEKSSTPGGFRISSLSFLDTLRGWAATFDNRIFCTVDGGSSWTQQQVLPAFELDAIDFVDSSYGWCVGTSLANPKEIFATTNGGATWFGQPTGAGQPQEFWSVDFVDRNHGWAAGLRLIVKTTDGGNAWDTSYVSPDARLYGVKFANVDTGWVVGERGRILGTTNGGTTWLVLREAGGVNDPDLNSVDAVSSQLVWASGVHGEILHTTNGGGLTSVQQTSSLSPERFAIEQNFPNPFNATTRISFTTAFLGHVSLTVYDVLGREVMTLVDEDLPGGRFEVTWNATSQASGVYFARFNVTDALGNVKCTKVNKLVLMK